MKMFATFAVAASMFATVATAGGANQSGVESLEISFTPFLGVEIINVDGEPGYPVKLEAIVINKRMDDACQFVFVKNKGETLVTSFDILNMSGIEPALTAVDIDLGDGINFNTTRCALKTIFVSLRSNGIWYDFKME